MGIFKQFKSILGKSETEAQVKSPDVVSAPVVSTERRTRKRVNTHKNRRVLIIDDSPTIVAALKKMLRSAGCITLEALDAEQGLELVRQEMPDLVFLDIVLPGMNGFAALRLMRRDAKTQAIPVIMISGNEQATEQFYAKRIGADDFMKKPFSRFEVFARMEALIENGKLLRVSSAAPEKTGAVPAAYSPPSAPTISVQLPAAAVPPPVRPSIEARRQLHAMGLQYFNQDQFLAAIERQDKLAMEFYIVGGGVSLNVNIGGQTLLELAQARGYANLVALLKLKEEKTAAA